MNGRFLEYNKTSLQWEEIDQRKAINKTCQALREKQPYLRKAMELLPILKTDGKKLEPLNDEEIDFIMETFCRKKNPKNLICMERN